MEAWVVVLGDIGRSPRMMYHTLSLAAHCATVHVVSHGGAAPLPQLTSAPNVRFTRMREPPTWLARLPRVPALMLKALLQLLQLLWLLLAALPRPHLILVQTPPAIPTLAVAWLAAARHRARLVLDWHNFGFTLMGLGLGRRHWLVRLARAWERFWGRAGHAHFCVTRAMQQELEMGTSWGIRATVLYDRPPAFFHRTDASTAHSLFLRLAPALEDPSFSDFLPGWCKAHQAELDQGTGTIATTTTTAPAAHQAELDQGTGTIATTTITTPATRAWRPGRPALVVSSTSWTPDEDFGVLLEAAAAYDRHAAKPQHASSLPDVLFLITGKGPQKERYLARLRGMRFARVAFRALWLEAQDYPALLGAADVGVSLHASSSGLDLPMKVVDMFGSGLPVCALSYPCIAELVAEGETGLLFASPYGLAGHLVDLLTGFPAAPSALLRGLQANVRARQGGLHWEGNWEAVAWPVLRGGGGPLIG